MDKPKIKFDLKQAQIDRFLAWVRGFETSFTPEAMDCGDGTYMMRKYDPANDTLMTITFEKKGK